MNPGTRSMPQRLPCPLDVRTASTRQARDDGTADHFCDRPHRLEVALRGDGKAGFNNVYPEAVELMRQPKLFLLIHAAAGRLLAISKGRVENGNSRFVHNYFLKRRACRLTVGNSPIRQAGLLRPALL